MSNALKLRCSGCQNPNKFKNFKRGLIAKNEIKNEDGSISIQHKIVGYLCKKCVGKGDKKKIIEEVRAQLGLKKYEPVTHQHIRNYFREKEDKKRLSLGKVSHGHAEKPIN